MTVLQLRHHIPIGGAARREAADGTESDLRVSLGFHPAWYHQRCGVSFVESYHLDPYARHEALVKMKTEICHAFPSVPYWRMDYPYDTWTISGCYGIYVIPYLFGRALRYAPAAFPELEPAPPITPEELKSYSVEGLLSNRQTEEIYRQMDIIEQESGPIHGYLNWQGVINNALHLRGPDIFVDMVTRPDFVHDLFALICDVMIAVAQRVQERQRQSGFYVNHFVVSNCVVNMISPGHYAEFVFPYDKKIAESFERFGVHTCEWDATPYLEELRKLPKVGYLDMGIMSDMKKAKTTFPKTRRAGIYSPVKLESASIDEIRRDMEKVYAELSPADVPCGVRHTTPDSRVKEFLELCRSIELKTPTSGRDL